MFDVLQCGLAPELIVPGDHSVEVEEVGFEDEVGMAVAGAAGDEGVGSAGRGNEGDLLTFTSDLDT